MGRNKFTQLFPIVPDFPCKLSKKFSEAVINSTFIYFLHFGLLYCIFLFLKLFLPSFRPTYGYNLPNFILTGGGGAWCTHEYTTFPHYPKLVLILLGSVVRKPDSAIHQIVIFSTVVKKVESLSLSLSSSSSSSS